MVEGGELCLRSLRNSENRSTITSAPFPSISYQPTRPNTKILDRCYLAGLVWVVAVTCLWLLPGAVASIVEKCPFS